MKPVLGVFVGDLHVGSDTGLCLPGYRIASKQSRPYAASVDQKWLHDRWQEFIADVKTRAKGKRLFVGLGGDLVDGVNHHNTTQTSGVYSDQVQMAIELLKPLVNAADLAYGMTGTAAHVGDCGDNDRSIYHHFKLDVVERGWVWIANRLILWKHHGAGVGALDWTKENTMITRIKSIRAECLEFGIPLPNAIIVHHNHRTYDPVYVRQTWGAVCGCWQFPTYYGNSFLSSVNIGGLVYDMGANQIERIEYRQAPQVIRHD